MHEPMTIQKFCLVVKTLRKCIRKMLDTKQKLNKNTNSEVNYKRFTDRDK